MHLETVASANWTSEAGWDPSPNRGKVENDPLSGIINIGNISVVLFVPYI